MAEIAAGAVVAEQIVSTTIEGGAVAGYAIAKPTQPLRAILRQFLREDEDALARSYHTITVIGDRAYIFGGRLANGDLPSNDIHAISTLASSVQSSHDTCYSASPLEDDGDVPASRSGHAACARSKHVVISGGSSSDGSPIEEDGCIWLWDSERLKWARLQGEKDTSGSSVPAARFDHHIFADDRQQDVIILHGGRQSQSGEKLKDTWLFDLSTRRWSPLPDAPVAASNAAFMDGKLFTITGSSELSCEIHTLDIGHSDEERKKKALKWESIELPTNPLTPGPKPREGGALVPIDTGLGRQYLVYIFGCRQALNQPSEKEAADSRFYSDMWTLQIPSKSAKPLSWTDLKPAVVKDAIREKLGYDSGSYSWSEVDVQPTEELIHEGKVHPGPRGWFGADVTADGKSVVLWGGLNAKGENESDGWLISLS